jgi:hypothetical protein
MMSTTQFLQELQEATAGLLFMSESDYPFQVIEWDQAIEITPDYLRQQSAGVNSQTPVRRQSVDEFFRSATSEPQWKKGRELETARRYQTLVRLLKEYLTDLTVYRVGEIDITIFILGKNESGDLVGLTTRVIET